ncbi:hypothetical protein [Seongchinamella sediminis]|uniref:hypothetical protein n=1 Tax=Seongchinamella sediminis TaxID=2283635 RepID=UPI001058EAE9|nr:hypothetical protein [Seongchinamella sediminis]
MAQPWPASHFEVVVAEPEYKERMRLDPIDSVIYSAPEGRPSDAGLEQSLNELAGRMRAAGHRPPRLEPIVEKNGKPAYRVFKYPFNAANSGSGSSSTLQTAAVYYGACGVDLGWGDIVPWMGINDLPGRTSKQFLGSLAHELTHALAANDPLGENCNRHAFSVTEGIPDAVTIYNYHTQYPGYIGHQTSNRSSIGLRSYALNLTYGDARSKPEKSTLDTVTGYATSSLWFFVAERFGGMQVFPHLLSRSLPKKASEAEVLRWMDNRLQSLPGLREAGQSPVELTAQAANDSPGLYEVYPHFVSEFASYGGERYLSWDNQRFQAGSDAARESWLKYAFNGCPRYTLSPGQMNARVRFTMGKNSARCFRLALQGFQGEVRTDIEVISDSLAKLDQLHLGWAWKDHRDSSENCYRKREQMNSKWPPCVLKAFSQTGPRPGSYARTWPLDTFDFAGWSGVLERTYIVSNMAAKPWTTQSYLDLELKVAVNAATVNGQPARPIGPLPPPPAKTVVKPLSKLDRKDLYGLQTEPPPRDDTVKGFDLVAEDAGGRTHERDYAIVIDRLNYGVKGPYFGHVTQVARTAVGTGVASSLHCRGAKDKPIGTVTQSNEDALRLSVNAELCLVDASTRTQCSGSGGCPVVDRVNAVVDLAFGWRQFGATAPSDIVTPGIERYIATMPGSWHEAIRFGAGTALPGTDASGAGDSAPGAPRGDDSSGLVECACTCTERNAFLSKLESLAADETSQGAIAMLGAASSGCASQCRREYVICAMDEGRARRKQEEAARAAQEAKRAAACDCSCDGIDTMLQQSRKLQAVQAAGGAIDMNELMQLSTCMGSCNAQMIQCMTRQR